MTNASYLLTIYYDVFQGRLIIVFFMFYCNKSPEGVVDINPEGLNSNIPINFSQSYFPLSVGNEWHYFVPEGIPETYIVKIISTIEINGKNYYEKEKDYGESKKSSFYREENGIVYVLQDSTE